MELQDWAEDECLFVTLTYNEEHLPAGRSVVPRDLQLFLKRIRKRLEPKRVRYFGVGEYGERTERPHYHLILFGVRSIDDVRACWPYGFIHVGTVSEQSAAYCAGYVTNYRSGVTDEEKKRLAGRHREFALMSRKPGLGARAMEKLARTLQTKDGSAAIAKRLDVPDSLRVGTKRYALGRYLRAKLRAECGSSEEVVKLLHELRLEMDAEALRVEGARAARESQRVQVGRIANVRESIVKSKGKL